MFIPFWKTTFNHVLIGSDFRPIPAQIAGFSEA
jgi:hypothetical protein